MTTRYRVYWLCLCLISVLHLGGDCGGVRPYQQYTAYIVFMSFDCKHSVPTEHTITYERRGLNSAGGPVVAAHSSWKVTSCHEAEYPGPPEFVDVLINTQEYQLLSTEGREVAIPMVIDRQEQLRPGHVIFLRLPRYAPEGDSEEDLSYAEGYCYPTLPWDQLERPTRAWRLFHETCPRP